MKNLTNVLLLSANICLTMVCCHQIQTAEQSYTKRSAEYYIVPEPAEYIADPYPTSPPNSSEEGYERIIENEFKNPLIAPYSTFSIDVDQASYSNVRRFLMNGHLPPADAVRIEELINYFHYDYPQPEGEHPFSLTIEAAQCPWNSQHQLVHVGLQGREVLKENLPPNNLVFLLDVSGSMNEHNKLPLLKSAFKMLVKELRPQVRVAIVVYAGASGLVLPSTPGSQKRSILLALEQLESGGSTAGAAGIQLAYKVAKQHFIADGNNRVILATDGDFNVGINSDGGLIRLIEQKREQGISLSVLGFGTGNYQDAKMEKLADNGNGNYAYIDNITEARKVLVREFSSTLFTIAKDVKLQVEFNPARVQAYRLIGYENRLLRDEDFQNDQKDAGELGAGHSVTALYEIIPTSVNNENLTSSVDPPKYQVRKSSTNALESEMMSLKLRYKKPAEAHSRQIESVLPYQNQTFAESSQNLRFSAAVASFGMLLRQSAFKGATDYKTVLKMARAAKGEDEMGYRAELIQLIDLAAAYSEDYQGQGKEPK